MCLFALSSVLATVAAGCGDPVADVRIAQLGPEVAGVEPSEFHRPGQPCVLCHGEYGGADPQMSLGGTIFANTTRGDELGIPVAGVKVTIIDAFGATNPKPIVTNCMGNFHVPLDDWNPGFPLLVEIECPPPGGRRRMSSLISRDGSCARCHEGAPNQGSPGWIVCGTDGYPAPTKQSCPGGVP